MVYFVWVKAPVIIEKVDEDCFTVYCPNHVATQGKTQDECIANIKEALELYLDETEEG